MTRTDYFPQDVFSGDAPPERSPRVIIGPHRYIQGDGVLDHVGRYLSIVKSSVPALLLTEGGMKRVGERITGSLKKYGLDPVTLFFEGECSDDEVARLVKQIENRGVDCLVVAGGGKCLDAGKCVAHCISVPLVACPTLASTDAPCSAVSVMYTPDGIYDRPWFFPESPAMVVVDTGVIVRAPVRHLVAGMGDAMSTYYEARTCFRNPKARNMIGARPTATAVALGELGARLLFENGEKAVEAAKNSIVNEAVENVVEANTLLSGVGFESGGLAASHGFAQVLPMIPSLHEHFLHGEMVALGLLTHCCLEDDREEARRIAVFFAKVGLPVHLGQLSLSPERNDQEVEQVVHEAMNLFFTHHEPFEVTPEKLKKALMEGDRIGKDVSKEFGEEAYHSLHIRS